MVAVLAYLFTFSSCLSKPPKSPKNLKAEYINNNGLAEISWDKELKADFYEIKILEPGTNNIVGDTTIPHTSGSLRDTIIIQVPPATYNVEGRSGIIKPSGNLISDPPAKTILEWDGIIEDVVVMRPIRSQMGVDSCNCNNISNLLDFDQLPSDGIFVGENLQTNQREINIIKISDGNQEIFFKVGAYKFGCNSWDLEICGNQMTYEFCDKNGIPTTLSEGRTRLKINWMGEEFYLKSGWVENTEQIKLNLEKSSNNTLNNFSFYYKKCGNIEDNQCPNGMGTPNG
ncbi:MAG: hypothetical protein R2879_09560 [Saprospiraceae bacterium]